jgi:hypothetical protein
MSLPTIASILPLYQREAAARSKEHAAVLVFLLGAPGISGDKRFRSNISDSGAIYWADVLSEGTWSRTEQALITAAASLWKSGNFEFSLGGAVTRLDDSQTELLIAMIRARKFGQIPERDR